jgi:hypothetical protein
MQILRGALGLSLRADFGEPSTQALPAHCRSSTTWHKLYNLLGKRRFSLLPWLPILGTHNAKTALKGAYS